MDTSGICVYESPQRNATFQGTIYNSAFGRFSSFHFEVRVRPSMDNGWVAPAARSRSLGIERCAFLCPGNSTPEPRLSWPQEAGVAEFRATSHLSRDPCASHLTSIVPRLWTSREGARVNHSRNGGRGILDPPTPKCDVQIARSRATDPSFPSRLPITAWRRRPVRPVPTAPECHVYGSLHIAVTQLPHRSILACRAVRASQAATRTPGNQRARRSKMIQSAGERVTACLVFMRRWQAAGCRACRTHRSM